MDLEIVVTALISAITIKVLQFNFFILNDRHIQTASHIIWRIDHCEYAIYWRGADHTKSLELGGTFPIELKVQCDIGDQGRI